MAKVFLEDGDNYVAASPANIYGSDGSESIQIQAGVKGVVVDQNIERVDLAGSISDFKFKQAGNQIEVFDADGELIIAIPVQGDEDGTSIAFEDGSVSAVLDGGVMNLGGAPVSSDEPAMVEPIPENIDVEDTSSVASPETAEDAQGDAEETAEETQDDAEETAEDAQDDAEETAEETRDDAEETAEDAQDDAEETAEETQNNIGEILSLDEEPNKVFGTDGDDIINASVIQNQINGFNVNTFTSEDIVDGGAGYDTLIIEETGSADINVSGYVSNVENIEFTSYATLGTTYDMANTTGVENFTNQYSTSKLSVDNAGEMSVSLKNINAKTTEINFDLNNAYGGTDDELNLKLENATNQAIVELNGNTIETLNIDSQSSSNRIDIEGTALDSTSELVITGDKDLSIDVNNSNSKIATVDASEFTGNLDLDLRNGAILDLDILGGIGDDRATIVNFNENDVVDLGDGKDLLSIDLTENVSTAASLKNIEQIAFRTSYDDVSATVNLDGADAIEEIYMENAQDGASDTLNLIKVGSTIKSVNFVNHDNMDGNVVFDNLNLTLANADTIDTLDVNFGNVISTANPSPARMADNKTLTLDELKAEGVENLNISTENLSKDTNATDDIRAGLTITSIEDDDLVNLTITSDTYLQIDSDLGENIKTIDASATTAGVTLDLSSAADATSTLNPAYSVTTGTGNDTLNNINVSDSSVTISTNAGYDNLTTTSTNLADKAKVIIDTGDGNDTIDIQSITNLYSDDINDSGSIKITTGDGIDTVVVNEALAGEGENVIITDFKAGVGGDNISISGSSNKEDFDWDNDINTEAGGPHLDVADDGDGKYDIFTNGADAFIYDDNGDLIVTLSGISDLTKLDADNFAI